MLLEDLKGKTVAEAYETYIKFTDGTQLSWRMEGDIGADSGWYQFLRVYIDNKRVASL